MAYDPDTDPAVKCHKGKSKPVAIMYGIRHTDMLAILSVEGGTDKNCKPVAPGDGAGAASFGQFTYGTAKRLGVKVGNPVSEYIGIGKHLRDCGYRNNRLRAIGGYNGGCGNPQMDYARKVDARAKEIDKNPFSDVKDAVGDAADTLAAPFEAADQLGNSLGSIAGAVNDLGKTETWIRILKIVGGILAIIIGVIMVGKNSIVDILPIGKIAKKLT